MPATQYEFGNTIRLGGTFFASVQGPQNPASAWLWIRSPEYFTGTDVLLPTQYVATLPFYGGASITQTGTGAFYSDHLASIGGQWNYAYFGYVGGAWFANQDVFRVRPNRVL
jgi:hypothetical protein